MDYAAGWPAAGGESCGTGFFFSFEKEGHCDIMKNKNA